MNSPSYKEKVLFQLSLYSNLVSGQQSKNLEEKLYKAIQDKLKENQKQIGRWEVVWGPAVEQPKEDGYAINAMYVAHSLDTPSWYVVSIAGTNSSSLLDWLFEDLLVRHQVPWVFGTVPKAKIALCTAIGLVILLTSKPCGDRPNAGKTLIEFLKALPEEDLELSITGHSLGGALSPTLALLLKDIQLCWDTECKTKISTMPTAGPTAGNSAFSRYSDGILKEIIDPQSTPFFNFFRQVGYQHVEAYERYFAIPGIAIRDLAELYQDPKNLLSPAFQRIAERAGISVPSELTRNNVPPGPLTVPIAGQLIELPTVPNDPRMPEIIELVTAELKKFSIPAN